MIARRERRIDFPIRQKCLRSQFHGLLGVCVWFITNVNSPSLALRASVGRVRTIDFWEVKLA